MEKIVGQQLDRQFFFQGGRDDNSVAFPKERQSKTRNIRNNSTWKRKKRNITGFFNCFDF